ncbi:hypothetical protein MAPG_00618 [Magnaporthiopsis poae ATCC 64411]|uniref:Uncharacterized protein n=1 Tax=Magnaporthiopsis poae (strain ATCC 64411 / 73-15) TaxID=644358 RepID=A0A0C4DLH5_MAGP6|nr:hypothetical protein MAPG_00618 [Magnaporthiopsis poae ATCC 64411]
MDPPPPPPAKERAHPADGSQSIDVVFLPKLTHIDPVIFVLAQEDFTQPAAQPARDRVERVKRLLEGIDAYTSEVRRNFHHLVRQEKRRIEKRSLLHKQPETPGGEMEPELPLDETRGIMAAMGAPIDRKTKYKLDGTARELELWKKFHGEEEPSNRENSLQQLGLVAEEGAHHIDEFLMHMANMRAKWEAILEREEIAMEGFVGAGRA